MEIWGSYGGGIAFSGVMFITAITLAVGLSVFNFK